MLGSSLKQKSDRAAAASCVAVLQSVQMRMSGGGGLKNSHRAGWKLGVLNAVLAVLLTRWVTLEESLGSVGLGICPLSWGQRCQAQRRGTHGCALRGLSSFVNHPLTLSTLKQESSPGLCQGGHFLQRRVTGSFSAGLHWGRLSEGQRSSLKLRLEIEKNPCH